MRALEFIRGHVTFKLPYDFSYHMKTPYVFVCSFLGEFKDYKMSFQNHLTFSFIVLACEKLVTTPTSKRIVVAENFWHSALKQQKKLEPCRWCAIPLGRCTLGWIANKCQNHKKMSKTTKKVPNYTRKCQQIWQLWQISISFNICQNHLTELE